MKKKLLISFIIVFVFLSLFILFLQKKESVTEKETQFLPMNSEQKTYLKETQEAVKKINERNKNIPATIKEKMKQQAAKMLSASDAMIQPVTFYGKVIDQNNNPIANVGVMFDGGRSAYSFGSGPDKTITNEQGIFSITEAKAYTLSIDNMKKEGYDFSHVQETFRLYNDPQFKSWKDYSALDNPYVFNGWKIEEYAKVIATENRYYFYPDGRTYSLDITTIKRHQLETADKGSFNVSFTRTDEHWQLTLTASRGGFVETADVYMNLAPESGYQESIVLEGDYKGRPIIVNKKYYLKLQSGEYARLIMDIRPYFKNDSAIKMNYVVNLEKGRNLAVKKQH
jgi:hypothetical protein